MSVTMPVSVMVILVYVPGMVTGGALLSLLRVWLHGAISFHLRKRTFVMSNFWDLLWLIASTFVFVAYLLVLFQIVVDLFRDAELGGFSKAIWIIGLIFLPFLTALVYIVARGGGMAERQRAALQRAKSDTDTYLRGVTAKSPADQIADAKALLDAGTINADEFAKLKAKALG